MILNNDHMVSIVLVKMAEALEESSTKRGRPAMDVDPDEVKYLLSVGFSKTKVAEIMGVSRQTIYNKTRAWGQRVDFEKYSVITDSDLDGKIKDIKLSHPHDGEVMMTGHLLSLGIRIPRERLRASIRRVDPVGTAERRSVGS